MGKVALALAALLGCATPAAAECVLNKIAELPVTMRGPRPEIGVKINGRDARFIIDSGAFFSVISPGVAAENRLKLGPAPSGFYLTGVGGTADVSVAKVQTLTLAGIDLHGIEFLVGGSEVGSSGVLGQNFLHLADVEYDLAHGMVALLRPKACSNASMAYWAAGQPVSLLPMENNDGPLAHTKAMILINGQKVHAIFDTGASVSILSLRVAARLGIRPDSPGVVPAGFDRGLGKRMIPQWIAPVANVKIGGVELRGTRLFIGDLGETAEMLLGADFFLSHHVYVANSQQQIYFTYNGGPIFAAASGAVRMVDGAGKPLDVPKSAAAPEDAEGLSRHGMALAARGDLAGALAALDRAVAAAPAEPRYLLQRAGLQRGLGHHDLAAADVDKALILRPDDPEALLARAANRLQAKRREEAIADLDAVARLVDKASDLRFTLGGAYSALDLREKAAAQYDLWVAAHPVDSRRPIALNGSCWSRALLGRELDKALADCTSAIRTTPEKGNTLDSRGLVNLRRGDLPGAIKDYDAALALQPKTAWSLYGRGLARLKLGQKDAGEKDLAEARALDPKLPEEARRYGIAP